jgi:energy-coupling factor transporter ATP-binding protein EcfA2
MSLLHSIEVFPGRDSFDGLKPFKISKLGPVVVLAGPNGSGKTRFLRAIKNSLDHAKDISRKDEEHRNAYDHYRDGLVTQVSEYREQVRLARGTVLRPILDRANQALRDSERRLAEHLGLHFYPNLQPTEISVVEVTPEANQDFADPMDVTPRVRDVVRNDKSDPFELIRNPEFALVRIDLAAERFVATNHPIYRGPDTKDTKPAFEDIRRALDEFVGAILEIDLTSLRTQLDHETLAAGAAKLSRGQRWLLNFWSSIRTREAISPTLLLLDEPELFLHPAALLAIFDELKRGWPQMQIVAATHSVPLIANLGYENVFWISGGEALYAGRKIQTVLSGLLGGPDNIELLQRLTLEPSRLAALTFAAECILPPTVLQGVGRDPQAGQLAALVKLKIHDSESKLRILDFGAGKSRLLTCLLDDLPAEITKGISYVAFDPDEKNRADAIEVVDRLHVGDGAAHVFSNFNDLRKKMDKEAFDIVVLCNVLHEIRPGDWGRAFDDICSVLHDNGCVLIIEDSQIPHGELAHAEGFIIADGTALQLLFTLGGLPEEIKVSDPFYEGRLLGFVLKKVELTQRPLALSRTLKYIRRRSISGIKSIRQYGKKTHKDGLIHSLHMTQYVNSSLALSELLRNKPSV